MAKQAPHHAYKNITWDNAPKILSSVQAAALCNCSVHALLFYAEQKKLRAIRVTLKTRQVYKFKLEDMKEFFKTYVEGNSRINRGMLRDSCRKPIMSKGYRLVYRPAHPRSNCSGYVSEHLLVMEKHLRRRIKKHQDIHHLNGDRADNRIENLKLYESRGQHLKEAHGHEALLRVRLKQLLNETKVNLAELSVEQKAEFFDMLVKGKNDR